jgi:hypothetical protein
MRSEEIKAFDWSSIELTEDELWDRFLRVDGDIICELCGRKYKQHPMEMRTLTGEGEPWLIQLCEGILGKT